MGDFDPVTRRLDEIASKLNDSAPRKRMAAKAGAAGKKAALDAAEKDLGGDRRFSGMRRKTALSAGYDDVGGTSVAINFRPAGLWRLAQDGRRRSGPIKPRGRNGKALRLPNGNVRASSRFGPSRGLGTFDEAVRTMQRTVPKAAADQFHDEIAKIIK